MLYAHGTRRSFRTQWPSATALPQHCTSPFHPSSLAHAVAHPASAPRHLSHDLPLSVSTRRLCVAGLDWARSPCVSSSVYILCTFCVCTMCVQLVCKLCLCAHCARAWPGLMGARRETGRCACWQSPRAPFAPLSVAHFRTCLRLPVPASRTLRFALSPMACPLAFSTNKVLSPLLCPSLPLPTSLLPSFPPSLPPSLSLSLKKGREVLYG